MKKILLYCVIVSIILTSCRGMLNDFDLTANEIFPDIKDGSVVYVVVIPNQGCGGCITRAEEFYNENKYAKNIKYIFTNIVSVKILNNKVDINDDNTFIDLDNNIIKTLPSDAKIYPSVIEYKNGKPVDIYYQSPTDNGLYKIDAIKLE